MKKLVLSLVLGALALTGAVVAPAALAHEPTPSCSQAQIALAEADRLHAAAVAADKAAAQAEAADKAAADAKAADVALAEAENRLAAALPKVLEYNENVYPGNTRPTLAQLTPGLLNQILVDPDLGGGARAEVEAALAAFATRDAAKKAAESDAAALQVEADKTDAVALRRVAGETDADALKLKLDAAVDTAGTACKGQNIPPRPRDIDCDEVTKAEAQRILDADRADPHDLDVDGDGIACEVDQVRVVPRTSSGVDTGA